MSADSSFNTMPLNTRLLKAVEEMGLAEATEVQQRAIPAVMAGGDLLVSAATGTGKTVAFLLPLMHQMLSTRGPKEGTRALILAPTRELAKQIFKAAESLAQFTGLKAGLITGGAEFRYQKALFRKDPEIIVATPGRMLEHLQQKTPLLDGLEFLVLDEGDRMLEMGFSDDVQAIAGYCNEQRQTLLFSATLLRRGIDVMASALLTEPETISISSHRQQHRDITQQMILTDDDDHKQRLLHWLLTNESYTKALVFCNSKAGADRLRGFLRGKKLKASAIHSDLTQDQRFETMNAFKTHGVDVLVATDVASRGIDVKGIGLVINFDMARNGDDYVHRIGRTGRAGEQGVAISFITAREWNLAAAIERYLQVTFERRTIDSLLGAYKGPKKVKSNGKAASKKKKTDVKTPKSVKAKKAKKAKQQKQQMKKQVSLGDGFAPMPIKKKKPPTAAQED